MQAEGLPAGIVSMLQATILFFVLGSEFFTRYRLRILREKRGLARA